MALSQADREGRLTGSQADRETEGRLTGSQANRETEGYLTGSQADRETEGHLTGSHSDRVVKEATNSVLFPPSLNFSSVLMGEALP